MGEAAVRLVTVTAEELRSLIQDAVRDEMRAHRVEESEVLTLEQTGKLLQLHPKVVLRYVRERGLPGKQLDREWRFRRPEVIEWLEEQAVKPGAPTARYARKLRLVSGGK